MQSIGDSLVGVLPTLRNKLQITGLTVIVVGGLLIHFAQPGNTAAILTGGGIGVSMIIFAQLFHFLRDFPENARATTFLISFALFCFLNLALLILTIFLLSGPSMTVTLEPDASLGDNKATVNYGPLPTIELGSSIWPTAAAATLEELPKSFAPDLNDDKLREEAKLFGTGVTYAATEKDGVLEVTASMPYERKMHGEGFITPLTVNRFRWLPPILSFKISNPRAQLLLISKAGLKRRG